MRNHRGGNNAGTDTTGETRRHSETAKGLGSAGDANQGLGVLRDVCADRCRQCALHQRKETVSNRLGILHERIGLHRGVRPLDDEVTGEHGPAQASDDTHGHMSTAPRLSAVAGWAIFSSDERSPWE